MWWWYTTLKDGEITLDDISRQIDSTSTLTEEEKQVKYILYFDLPIGEGKYSKYEDKIEEIIKTVTDENGNMSYSKYVEAWNNKHRDNRIDISKDWFYGNNVEDLFGNKGSNYGIIDKEISYCGRYRIVGTNREKAHVKKITHRTHQDLYSLYKSNEKEFKKIILHDIIANMLYVPNKAALEVKNGKLDTMVL